MKLTRSSRTLILWVMAGALGLMPVVHAAPAKAGKTPALPTVTKPPPPSKPVTPPKAATTVPVTLQLFEAAEQLYKDDKTEEALAAFKNFEKTQPFSTLLPQVIAYEGWCYYILKRYPDAANAFERLLKQYPESPFAVEGVLKKAECYREMKNYATAVETYRMFQRKYPRDPKVRYDEDQYRKLRAQAMLGEGWVLCKMAAQNPKPDLRAAKAVIQQLQSTYADDPAVMLDTLFLKGQILNTERSYDAARAVYAEIAKRRNDPRAAAAIFLAAEAMWDAKKYADAIPFYKSIQSRAATLSAIQKQITALKAQQGEFIKAGARADYEARLTALQTLLSQFQADQDRRAVALLRVGNCYQLQSKPEEASVVYQFLLDSYPVEKLPANEKVLAEQALYRLIQVLTERKQIAKAKRATEIFKEKFPNSALGEDTSFMQAETQYGTKDFTNALKNYLDFRTKGKNTEMIEVADFRIPACYFELEQFDKAITEFDAFLKKHPTSKLAPEVMFLIGRAHFMIANKTTDPATAATVAKPHLVEAVKAFETVRTKYPNYESMGLLTFQLGYLYSYLGAYDIDPKTGKLTTTTNYDKAIAAYQEFNTKWPDYKNSAGESLAPEAWYQISQNQVARGHPDEAVKAYQTLIDQYSDSKYAPYAGYEIAGAYAALKKTDAMIAALQNFIKKYPDHEKFADAVFVIAQQMEALKKPKEAIDEYRTIIAKAAVKKSEPLLSSAIGAELRIVGILEAQDLKAAVQDCESFLAQFKDQPVAARTMITQLRDMYRRAKQFDDGYAKLEQLAAQHQQNAVIRLAANTAIIELALGEKDYARANSFTIKLLADPEKAKLPPLSLAAIGNTYLRTERYEDARNIFEKMVSQTADDPRMAPIAYLGLGQAYVFLKQYDKAEPPLQKLMTNPSFEAQLAMAKVKEATGKVPDAVKLYTQVLAGARGEMSLEAAFRLGNIFFNNLIDPQKEKDNKKVALAYYARLLFSSGPMADEAGFRSAQCHQTLGNVEAARNSYKLYLSRFKDGKYRKDAEEAMAKLPPPATQP